MRMGRVVAAEEVSVEMRVQETSLTICLQITVAIQTLAAEIIAEWWKCNISSHISGMLCTPRPILSQISCLTIQFC